MVPKPLKRARSPSPDMNQLSESEMQVEDLDIEVDKNFDSMTQAAIDDETTSFYFEQLEKELAGNFWVLQDEADTLYGVCNIFVMNKICD